MALFGVELNTIKISAPNSGGEGCSVIRDSDDIIRVVADRAIFVNVIKTRKPFIGNDQGVIASGYDLGPAHVRNFEPRVAAGIETANIGIYPPETDRYTFFAAPAQHLHSETNSKNRDRPLERQPVEHFAPAARFERRHASIESANPRKHQPSCTGRISWVACHSGIGIRFFEHPYDRANVADARIDYSYVQSTKSSSRRADGFR